VQGADILAHSDKGNPKQVFMPDFLNENYASLEWYPPDNEEKQKKIGAWLQNAAPPKHLPKIPVVLSECEQLNPNIKSWGVIGYCWGGKLVSLIAGGTTKFKAGVQTSPVLVDPEEAKKVGIPMAILLSKDEPVDDWDQYKGDLKVDHVFKRFQTVPHGFMSARGDLKDPANKKVYEQGYQIALGFFNKHL